MQCDRNQIFTFLLVDFPPPPLSVSRFGLAGPNSHPSVFSFIQRAVMSPMLMQRSGTDCFLMIVLLYLEPPQHSGRQCKTCGYSWLDTSSNPSSWLNVVKVPDRRRTGEKRPLLRYQFKLSEVPKTLPPQKNSDGKDVVTNISKGFTNAENRRSSEGSQHSCACFSFHF